MARTTDRPEALRWVLVLGACVFGSGIGWGLPNTETWQSDSLAPYHPLIGLSQLFSFGYFHKYPLVQQAILGLLDLPVVLFTFVTSLNDDGFDVHAFVHRLRSPACASALIVIGRAVTACMATLTVYFMYRLSRRLADERTALVTALLVCLNAAMNQLASVAKVDVPYVFWAVVSLDLLVRAVQSTRTRDYVLAALTACLSFGSKDQAYAIFVLPWIFYIVIVPARFGEPATVLRRRWLSKQHLAFAGAFVLGALLVENALLNFDGLIKRVQHLTGDAGFRSAAYSTDLSGAFALFWDFNWTLVQSMGGLPIYALSVLGLGWALAKLTARERALQLTPLLASASYYLFFVQVVRQSHDRFSLFPSVILLHYAGFAAVRVYALLRGRARRIFTVAMSLSALYALCSSMLLDVDLWLDPRYEAERYMREQLPRGSSIEYYAYPHYLPRFPDGVRAYRIKARALELERRSPDFLVLSSLDYARYLGSSHAKVLSGRLSLTQRRQRDRASELAELYRRLFAGKLGYEQLARFDRKLPRQLRRHPSVPESVLIYRKRAT